MKNIKFSIIYIHIPTVCIKSIFISNNRFFITAGFIMGDLYIIYIIIYSQYDNTAAIIYVSGRFLFLSLSRTHAADTPYLSLFTFSFSNSPSPLTIFHSASRRSDYNPIRTLFRGR